MIAQLSLPVMVALSHLSDREREVVVDRYLLGLSQHELGRRQGCQHQAIHAVEKRALGKLAELLTREALS